MTILAIIKGPIFIIAQGLRNPRDGPGLAQCWESLSIEECRVCLDSAKKEVMGCVPSGDGRGMNAGCFLRYSTQKFYENDSQGDGGNKDISLYPGISLYLSLILVMFVVCFMSL